MRNYRLTVSTGSIEGAGTNSVVTIVLVDVNGRKSETHRLDTPGVDDFEKGHANTFLLTDRNELGTIASIIVTKDNSGKHPDWYLEEIGVTDGQTGKSWICSFRIWFSQKDGLSHTSKAVSASAYQVRIKTSREDYSGTDAGVALILHGERGSHGPVRLDNSTNNAERGDTDLYNLLAATELGELQRITLQTNNAGSKSGWMPAYVQILDEARARMSHVWINDWLTKSTSNITYVLGAGSVEEIGSVYWCARDLSGIKAVGNHHFLTIFFHSEYIAKQITSAYGIGYKTEKVGSNYRYFTTIGAFTDLTCKFNQADDVFSVREKLDPDQHTSIWKADFDMERHFIAPQSRWSERQQIELIITAAKNFQKHTSRPGYDLNDTNCATFVNSLLKYLNYPYSYRVKKGEFEGIDWGEENTIPRRFFDQL